MTDRDILLDLITGKQCACTVPKKPRTSFCQGCYGRLHEGLQRALYERDGSYPDAYRRAREFLGFPELVRKAPDSGPRPAPTQLFHTTHK